MITGSRKTAISTEQRKIPSPAERRAAEERASAIGLDHANRRQPSWRNCSYSSRVSPQLHQRKTRNCGLVHLRREAATTHEGRVCKVQVGVREGWPCVVGYTPPLHLQHVVVLPVDVLPPLGVAAHCIRRDGGISSPCSSIQGTFEGTTYSSTS